MKERNYNNVYYIIVGGYRNLKFNTLEEAKKYIIDAVNDNDFYKDRLHLIQVTEEEVSVFTE